MAVEKLEHNTTEKITINLSVVELGYIDLLVSEGYYTNRTDFIKAAIRKNLGTHEENTKKILEKNESYGFQISVGIGGFTKRELETMLEKGQKKRSVIVIGLFILSKDITLELLEKTVESIRVYGICKCSTQIKERYLL